MGCTLLEIVAQKDVKKSLHAHEYKVEVFI